MNRRFFIVCFFMLVLAFAFNMASAQNQAGGAAQSVVLESVDEDIVDYDDDVPDIAEETPPSESAKSGQQEKSDDGDDNADAESDESDEIDIDKLLAGDDEEDLLADDKPVAAENVTIADSVSADSPLSENAEILSDDSQETPEYGGRGGRGRNIHRPQTVVPAPPVDEGPPVIEDGRSINFAHNLSEYRSPRFAMLLSFLVPGLGQAYSRNYIKAGAFGAAEIAAIGTAIYFNRAGKSKKQEAYRFADRNFSVESLRRYDDGMRLMFGDSLVNQFLPFDSEFYTAATRRESYFYESIRGRSFVPGWTDVQPRIDEILENSGEIPMRWLDGVTSRSQDTYNSMMKDSKSKYDAVNYALYVVLINHIASAIDAGFTAKAHNSRLLGKDNSVWERISIEQQYVFSGTEMSPGAVLKLKF